MCCFNQNDARSVYKGVRYCGPDSYLRGRQGHCQTGLKIVRLNGWSEYNDPRLEEVPYFRSRGAFSYRTSVDQITWNRENNYQQESPVTFNERGMSARGLYAYRDIGDVMRTLHRCGTVDLLRPLVVCVVAIWGTIYEFPKGFLSSRQRIEGVLNLIPADDYIKQVEERKKDSVHRLAVRINDSPTIWGTRIRKGLE